MREKIETRELPCVITDSERVAFGNESADLVYLIVRERAALKTHSSEKRAEIQSLEDRLNVVSEAVRTGEEMRAVEVAIRFVHSRGIAQIVRTDTGDIVNERPMTPGEKQLALDMPPMGIGRSEGV